MGTYLLNTDPQQSVLGRLPGAVLAYAPYGALGIVTTSVVGFCGQHRDPLTANYLLGNGHRCYSPTLMRFLSPDHLSPFLRGGVNAYSYCSGDPVNRVDPSGQWSFKKLLIAGEVTYGVSGALGVANVTAAGMGSILDDIPLLPTMTDPLGPANPPSVTGGTRFMDFINYQISLLTRVVTVAGLLDAPWARPLAPVVAAVTAARSVTAVAGFAGVAGNLSHQAKRARARGLNPYYVAAQAYAKGNNPMNVLLPMWRAIQSSGRGVWSALEWARNRVVGRRASFGRASSNIRRDERTEDTRL